MLAAFVFWPFLLLGIFLSLWMRGRQQKRGWHRGAAETGGENSSPIAQALGNLLSVAGGIYLSGQLLVEFLKLPEIPRVTWRGADLDLLALLSLWAAIIQPFLIRLLNLFRQKR
jgi:hypothetical protein